MDLMNVARNVAGELAASGAQAVVLAGSHARGAAGPRSDVDLYAIGSGPHYQLHQYSDALVSISWRTMADEQTAMLSPAQAGTVVPGWRSAIILHDPLGIAAQLVLEARAWTWDAIGNEQVNSWVAEELTGYAEEVHKLVAALEQGSLQMAAVQRSVIALRVPVILATHLRLLYDSENVLWDLVSEQLGPAWARTQATALGVLDRPHLEMCHAALTMFNEACLLTQHLFDERQRAVIEGAMAAIRSVSPAVN